MAQNGTSPLEIPYKTRPPLTLPRERNIPVSLPRVALLYRLADPSAPHVLGQGEGGRAGGRALIVYCMHTRSLPPWLHRPTPTEAIAAWSATTIYIVAFLLLLLTSSRVVGHVHQEAEVTAFVESTRVGRALFDLVPLGSDQLHSRRPRFEHQRRG